ncbi:hypothetical protein FUA24_24270 [Seonamhaeicola marinus]|uniref:WG repeat-containing protein n=2 Tax=Seonamhaeicola marinus TaxID=1912246 RepID=A0A5D0H3Z9_9FLAO|nr:hypothetical protein FUA24_24270 [Seonamhaeicola marinus]
MTVDEWHKHNATQKIYAFVGKKISMESYDPPKKDEYRVNKSGDSVKVKYIKFDQGFKLKYKVIQNIHNEIKTDTIEFIAFDHYGIPPFSKYEHVLLFMTKEKEQFVHCKYQYFGLYKTESGRWAGIYDKSKYRKTRIQPIQIDFLEDVSVTLNDYLKKHRYFLYPKKYFEHFPDKVVTSYGNYVEDLFIIKKEGVLRARGYFE